MKMLHFGHAWPEPPDISRAPAMVCFRCVEPIASEDSGVVMGHFAPESVMSIAYHRECHARQVMGSLGHLQKRCSCYGGTEEDPEHLTRRQAARAALAWVETTMSGHHAFHTCDECSYKTSQTILSDPDIAHGGEYVLRKARVEGWRPVANQPGHWVQQCPDCFRKDAGLAPFK